MESEERYTGLADIKTEGETVRNETVPYEGLDRSRWEPPTLHGKLWGERDRSDGFIRGDMIRLSTGREIYANCGFLGISENMELSEGYDGTIDTGDLSTAEKHELANYVIGLWTRWKEQA